MLSEYKRRQIEHSDQSRPRYNLEPIRWAPVEQFYAEREYALALKLLGELVSLNQIESILICGVGAGADLHYWLEHMSLKRAYGLDFSLEAIKAAQRRVQLNQLPEIVDYFRADFENLPLGDDRVELGVFVHSLHHAENPRKAFKELWRVSQLGVLLIEPLLSPVTKLFSQFGLAQKNEEAGNEVIRFQARQFIDWAGDTCETHRSRSCLYYYRPFIFRRVLPLFNSRFGFNLFKLLYRIGDATLIPLRSKLVSVLLKNHA